MVLVANSQTNTGKGSAIWEGKEILTAGETGEPMFLPGESGKVESWLVGLAITTGNGKIQYSISPRDNVLAGSGVWRDWDNGVVSSSNDDVFYPVTAVRGVCTSGAIIVEVVVS